VGENQGGGDLNAFLDLAKLQANCSGAKCGMPPFCICHLSASATFLHLPPFCICHLLSLSTNVHIRNDRDDPHKIPIKKIISDETIIRCDVSMDAAVITKAVGITYQPFADRDVAVGIRRVLKLTLKALLGVLQRIRIRRRNSTYL
jgi:hypothetical protein